MNANELADDLAFKHIVGDDSGAFRVQLQDTLRQQQAEIDSLQKNLDVALMIVNEPAKTLTDEEIWKLWQKHLSDDIPVFARAILRKAQEK